MKDFASVQQNGKPGEVMPEDDKQHAEQELHQECGHLRDQEEQQERSKIKNIYIIHFGLFRWVYVFH